MVYGTRHTVNVPLLPGGGPAGQVDTHPEAPVLRAGLQSAVANGMVDSKEAAARLVALLRRGSAAGAAKAPPPGFGGGSGPTAFSPPPGFGGPSIGGVSGAPFININDPSVAGPLPLGRYQPIQPPSSSSLSPLAGSSASSPSLFSAAPGGGGSRSVSPQPPSYDSMGGGSMDGGVRAYSMWSGLPGIDLGASLFGGGGGFPGFGSSHDHRSSSSLFGYQQQDSAMSTLNGLGYATAAPGGPIGAKAPPPGFGSASQAAGSGGDGSGGSIGGGFPSVGSSSDLLGGGAKGRPYQPFGSSGVLSSGAAAAGPPSSSTSGGGGGYNPLQAQQAAAAAASAASGAAGGSTRAPPPGMAAYRPSGL